MKMLISKAVGGPATLELVDAPVPQPGPGEVRVRVLACGINYPDVLIIEDKYQFKPDRPFAPGTEIAGIIDAVGDGVADWRPCDRIIAPIQYGGLSEYIVLPVDNLFRMPEGMEPVAGAALIFTYATTLHALADRGELKTGETLLVLGAAGGVGLAAIEIGKAMGARVVAGVSSDEKAAAAKEAGADVAFVYDPGPFDKDGARALAQAVKQAVGPGGADVAYDPVGGPYTEAALRSLAWGGRHLVIGFPAGISAPPLNLILLKSVDIRGVFWGAFAARDPKANLAHVEQLLSWWEEGRIRPRIDRVYPLGEGGDAITRLSSRSAIGKVVVRVSEEDASLPPSA
jgi:NADPH:quinone reductase-like Zn-dependent oxidoreductase